MTIRKTLAMILTLVFLLTTLTLTAYADSSDPVDLGDCEILFDHEDWKVYVGDSIDDGFTLDDLNITVVDRSGSEVPAEAYNLVFFAQLDWDNERDEPINVSAELPLKISNYSDFAAEGFGTFYVKAVAKENSGFIGEIEPREFMLWHKYSLNYFGATVSFRNEYKSQSTWFWHDYYRIPVDGDNHPAVFDIAMNEIDPSLYTLTYYRRNTEPVPFDDPEYDRKLYPTDDPMAEMPTEIGAYYAVLEGKEPYYGKGYVDFDIVERQGYAVVYGKEERYGSDDTILLREGEDILVYFILDPPNDDLIPGWRNDLFTAQGFALDDDPVFPEGEWGAACAHIAAGEKHAGDTGTLSYSFYRISDIFGEGAPGWVDAEPVYTFSVNFKVTAPEAEPVNLLGDTDGDQAVTILDATAIQRHLADLPIHAFNMLCADADRSGSVEILDATSIQRSIAGLSAYCELGEEVVYGTYYAAWNIEEELLPEGHAYTGADAERAREEIRRALNILIDRERIIAEVMPEGVTRHPASAFVPKWITDANGNEFHTDAGLGDGKGYFDAHNHDNNLAEATAILRKYYHYDEASGQFTDIPDLTYVYNDSPAHKTIAERIQADFEALGIELMIVGADWNSYSETLAEGDYSLAREGWVDERDDPMLFLELFKSDNEDNPVDFSKAGSVYSLDLTPYDLDFKVENGTWAEIYDVLIEGIRDVEEPGLKNFLMHRAEDMLMDTGCIVPLYYY